MFPKQLTEHYRYKIEIAGGKLYFPSYGWKENVQRKFIKLIFMLMK